MPAFLRSQMCTFMETPSFRSGESYPREEDASCRLRPSLAAAQHVAPATAPADVEPSAAVQSIGLRPTSERVVAALALQAVPATLAPELVVAAGPDQPIVARLAGDEVVAGASLHPVVPQPGTDPIRAAQARHHVVATERQDDVPSPGPGDGVGGVRAGDGGRLAQALDLGRLAKLHRADVTARTLGSVHPPLIVRLAGRPPGSRRRRVPPVDRGRLPSGSMGVGGTTVVRQRSDLWILSRDVGGHQAGAAGGILDQVVALGGHRTLAVVGLGARSGRTVAVVPHERVPERERPGAGVLDAAPFAAVGVGVGYVLGHSGVGERGVRAVAVQTPTVSLGLIP